MWISLFWGKWSSSMTRHSSTLFHATSCPWENFLMPAGTSWESAKIRLGRVDTYKMQRMPRFSDNCETTGHTDALWHWSCTQNSGQKKNDGNVLLQNLIIVWYMQGILLKTNKQASKQANSCLELHHQSARPQVLLFHCHGNPSVPMNDDWKLLLANSSLN